VILHKDSLKTSKNKKVGKKPTSLSFIQSLFYHLITYYITKIKRKSTKAQNILVHWALEAQATYAQKTF
jgi:hypothetical protein